MATRPEYVFRYCTAQRAIEILSKTELYLATPNTMNDLFEFSVAPVGEYEPAIGRFLETLRFIAYGHLSLKEAESFAKKSSEEELLKTYQDFQERLGEQSLKLRVNCGITCFSEQHLNQRMWATYADSHTGACIQFWNERDTSAIHRELVQVQYSDEADPLLVSTLFDRSGRTSAQQIADALFARKTRDWEQEREWRIVRVPDESEVSVNRKFVFQREDVRRVFLGPNMSAKDKQTIRNIDNSLLWGIYELVPDVSLAKMHYKGIEVSRNASLDFEWWAGKNRQTM